MDAGKVNAAEFERIDRFPTTLKSTYFEEIRKILNYRKDVLNKENLKAYKKDIPLIGIESKLLMKYAGGKRLRVQKNDAVKLQKIIRTSIEGERALFLRYLNSDTAVRSKLLLLSKRKNINRWYGRLGFK